MAFSNGSTTTFLKDILSKVTEFQVLSFYLGITEIPCIINSPLREDKNPSFGLHSSKEGKIHYLDLSTKESGGTFDLLAKKWGCSFSEVLGKVSNDISNIIQRTTSNKHISTIRQKSMANGISDLQCKVRNWEQYDLDYWDSYGISLEWLKYAEVYPISHKIIIKDNKKYVFGADKYAYAYVEHKENKVSLKIYQPFNNKGYKWANRHDGSVISLWTKVPVNGLNLFICSSVKDALCFWANTGIPAISLQGEGYNMSQTAISELKRRFKNIYILYDNDEPGILDAKKLAEETGFTNVILPQFGGGKDVSDYRKIYGQNAFLRLIKTLVPFSNC